MMNEFSHQSEILRWEKSIIVKQPSSWWWISVYKLTFTALGSNTSTMLIFQKSTIFNYIIMTDFFPSLYQYVSMTYGHFACSVCIEYCFYSPKSNSNLSTHNSCQESEPMLIWRLVMVQWKRLVQPTTCTFIWKCLYQKWNRISKGTRNEPIQT